MRYKRWQAPVVVAHSLTVPSDDAVSTKRPSGDTSAPRMGLWWPCRVTDRQNTKIGQGVAALHVECGGGGEQNSASECAWVAEGYVKVHRAAAASQICGTNRVRVVTWAVVEECS